MIDLMIKRGPASQIIVDGKPNPRLIIEKGCLYLCTDTAELFLGTNVLNESTNEPVIDEATGEEILTLKKINGSHSNAVDQPTNTPSFGPVDGGILGAYADEEGNQYLIFTDGSELAFGAVVGQPGRDGLTVAVKIGDTLYEHVDGVIELPEIELGEYALRNDLPTKVSDLINDANFITLADIPEIDIDLSGYAKIEDIPVVPTDVSAFANDAGYLTSIPGEYVTESELAAKNYLTEHQSLANYATKTFVENTIAENQPNLTKYALKTDIPDVSNFITSVPAEYVTESELNSKGYLTEHQDISHLALKTSIPTKVGELDNDANYATEQFVTEAIADHVQLDNLAKKEDVEEVKTKLEANVLPTINNTILPVIEKAATQTWVQDQGYLTEHQSLDAYATKEFVAEAINNIEIPEPEKVDLSNYYTKLEVDNAIANVEVDLSAYAKTEDIPDVSNFITEIPSNYVTEEELNAKGYITEHQNLSEYAKKSELFSKSYNDLTDTPAIPNTEGLASEQYVDAAISSAISSAKPNIDLTPYALKSDLESKADEIPFKTNKYVQKAVGGFTVGESVRGLTVAELFAKLLELSDVPQGVVDDIIVNGYEMYQFNDDIEIEKIEFTHTIFESAEEYASAPTESTFYQYTYINDAGEEVTESGYQHYSLAQDFIYYMVMLPDSLTIGENVKVQAWSPSKNMWMDTLTVLESDQQVIADNFAEVGLTMPTIPDGYKMWIDLSDVNPGNKVRYIIIE